MPQSNSFNRSDASSPLPGVMYPGTHAFLEDRLHRQAAPSHATSLNAAVWHAQQIVEFALKVGDLATAALMTEAFARIALHAQATPRPQMTSSGHKREYLTLRHAALDLLAMVYPSGTYRLDMTELDRMISETGVRT